MIPIKLNLKNNGISEWLIVRLSAILIILYIIYLFNFIVSDHNFSYEKWCNFFYSNTTKIFNIITFLLILKHTWVGMKHILEDYIRSVILKKIATRLISFFLYVYLLYGIIIIWGI